MSWAIFFTDLMLFAIDSASNDIYFVLFGTQTLDKWTKKFNYKMPFI